MKDFILLVLAVLSGVACADSVVIDTRSSVERDLRGFAMATCFVVQDEPFLKDQGDAWASAIIQRMSFSPEILHELVAVVRSEVDSAGVAIMRSESPGAEDKNLPVMFCSEIIGRSRGRLELI